ncbi:MAG TPA: septum formation family protein [Acidimicrobiia bacterium]|nr:septum formation family protein [Acidimicrobiia bacterium]
MKQIRLILLLALFVAACGGNVFTLEVGTCFDDTNETEVSSVPEVDCSEPHDNEVFAVFDYTESDIFPGSTAMNDAAQELCVGEFEAYVGLSYEESALEVLAITPTQGSWDSGDREILCALYNLDFSKLTGSMQGAAR